MGKSSALPVFSGRSPKDQKHCPADLAKGAGLERTGHKFPEGNKTPKLRLLWGVVMGCPIVHISCQPYNVGDLLVFDVAEDISTFELPP